MSESVLSLVRAASAKAASPSSHSFVVSMSSSIVIVPPGPGILSLEYTYQGRAINLAYAGRPNNAW